MEIINKKIIQTFPNFESQQEISKLVYRSKEDEDYKELNDLVKNKYSLYIKPFFSDDCCIANYPN